MMIPIVATGGVESAGTGVLHWDGTGRTFWVLASLGGCHPPCANLPNPSPRLEEAVDIASKSCIRGELHPLPFYFGVLHSYAPRSVYSHFRPLDWLCIVPSSLMITDMRSDDESVPPSLRTLILAYGSTHSGNDDSPREDLRSPPAGSNWWVD
jgi:hypothetical protein